MSTQPMLRICAAVVDTRQLTMYKMDGSTEVIPQGDPRVRLILDQAIPQITEKGYADIDVTVQNSYKDFEEKSNGVVRLFRIAKKTLSNILNRGAPIVESQIIGSVKFADEDDENEGDNYDPVRELETAASESAEVVIQPAETKLEEMQRITGEIIKHATPVTAPHFHEVGVAKQNKIVEDDGKTPNNNPEDDSTHTMVAVIDNQAIPGVEKIKNQLENSARLGSTVGVEKFLSRLGAVIQERRHSVADLLKFMERGDLPIADDGCVVIFKVLKQKNGKYVDCHTGLVPQQIGSLVCMDPALVDPNRGNECSNGLHVARRGYISNFSGDVCVIAKVAPEDVIAVPSYDANKMRVCAYHILFQLSNEDYSKLKQNRPFTDNKEGQILLGRVLRGDHPPPIEEVRIGGHKGTKIKISPMNGSKAKVVIKDIPAEALNDEPDGHALDSPVEAKSVEKAVEKVKASMPTPAPTAAVGGSRKDRAMELYQLIHKEAGQDNKKRAGELLMAFKRAAKVSWHELGISPGEVIILTNLLDPKNGASTPTPKKPDPKAKGKATKAKPAASSASQREDIAVLWAGVLAGDKESAIELLALKKKAKKSFAALSLPEEAGRLIEELIG